MKFNRFHAAARRKAEAGKAQRRRVQLSRLLTDLERRDIERGARAKAEAEAAQEGRED